ncbi:MAG: phosphotransferase [Planctomycetota bacterium]
MTAAAVDDVGAMSPSATRWVAQTLKAEVCQAHALEGGRNNRVFRIELDNDQTVLFKAYFRSDTDPRDRLGHEFGFSTFARGLGIRAIPEPLAQSVELNAALYAYVPGRMLKPNEVETKHVDQAIELFQRLHADPKGPDASALPPGSEACFTNIDHVALVDQRVRKLDAISEPTAAAFVERELKPYWASIHPPIAKAADAFEPTPTCVSPSDFGFHNAIVRDDDGSLVFHDFEYAGQDDPAKLLGDFFHQPRIPAPKTTYPAFENAVVETLHLQEAQRHRFRTMLPVYRVKWCGIVLAPLLPEAAQRRKFAGIDIAPNQIVERATALLHQPLPTSH